MVEDKIFIFVKPFRAKEKNSFKDRLESYVILSMESLQINFSNSNKPHKNLTD